MAGFLLVMLYSFDAEQMQTFHESLATSSSAVMTEAGMSQSGLRASGPPLLYDPFPHLCTMRQTLFVSGKQCEMF